MRTERSLASLFARVLRAFVGVPDYEAYLAHWRAHHAGQPPLDRAAFVRDRQAARYARGRSRCC